MGKLTEIRITSEAREVTIDRALGILEAVKMRDPDALVDVTIYHVIEETEIPTDAIHVDKDPKVLRDTRDKILERSDRR